MTNRDIRQLMEEADEMGWAIDGVTGSGHIRLIHPQATTPVVVPSTPSDWRGLRNTRAQLRRALRTPTTPTGLTAERSKSCAHCGADFPSPDDVIDHILAHHTTTKKDTEKEDPMPKAETMEDGLPYIAGYHLPKSHFHNVNPVGDRQYELMVLLRDEGGVVRDERLGKTVSTKLGWPRSSQFASAVRGLEERSWVAVERSKSGGRIIVGVALTEEGRRAAEHIESLRPSTHANGHVNGHVKGSGKVAEVAAPAPEAVETMEGDDLDAVAAELVRLSNRVRLASRDQCEELRTQLDLVREVLGDVEAGKRAWIEALADLREIVG